MSFAHLHVHTHYSFLQGLGAPEDFAAAAKKLGIPALAITDSGNLYGAFEFYKACLKEGIKPIIGMEAYIAAGEVNDHSRNSTDYAITLLAKSITGYRNLVQIVTDTYLRGFYSRPRMAFETLARFSGDVICLSGAAGGEIPQLIVMGKTEEFILQRVEWYESVFGKENFYLEIQERKDHPQQANINKWLVDFARKYNKKLVATNYVHYPTMEEASAQDLFSALGDGRPLDDPDRKTLIEWNYSLRSPDEMREIFAYAPDAVENTLEIAAKIDIQIPYGKPLLPVYELNERQHDVRHQYDAWLADRSWAISLRNEEWFLRYLCMQGLNKRFDFGLSLQDIFLLIAKSEMAPVDKKLSSMSLGELQEKSKAHWSPEKQALIATFSQKNQDIFYRLEYELLVVDLMGFNAYFCIVGDFINWAKDNGVPVGPGRGSAAGALLAYLSGITDLDPLKYGLLFERFLNPARVSMPDIDVDFSDEGRDRVIEYVREKYGSDHVAQICTFGTMAARAAIKDVGRALGMPFQKMNEWAKLIPGKPGTTIEWALEESLEFKQAYDGDDKLHRVVDQAKKFEGSVRQLGVHACAVVIAPEPITQYCPIQHPPKDTNGIVTQFSAGPLEDIGLLKMDFLGLRNLTIIDRCIRIVKNHHGIDIDLAKISYEDQKVFDVFARGDTTGVFQVESPGMRKYLQELKPNVFEDIIVMLSLYRPGPLMYIPTYIKRKHGREKVSYPHPSLEKILKVTQGIAVYQEQIMQLVQAFAGFSLGEADILRRAIGKKKIDLLMEQKVKFVQAAKEHGHDEKLALHIFQDIIEPFAGYGFNKSHAACYAMISYQTAYLKAYWTTEFMTALMVSDEEDTDRIVMEVNECRAKGIAVLAPDVNQSRKHFTFIDKQSIRFGLKAIKGLGDGAARAIMDGRSEGPYVSLEDFAIRSGGSAVNKKSLESLIFAGALDGFGERARLLAGMTKISDYLKETEKKKQSRQIGFFDLGSGSETMYALQLPEVPPMSFEEKISHEREVIGYMVSGSPLTGLSRFIEQKSIGLEYVREYLKEMEKTASVDETITEEAAQENTVAVEGGEVEWALPPEEVPGEPEEEITPAKKEYKKEKKKVGQLVGYVSEVRKIQTKTEKMMLIAQCQSSFFNFTLVIFPKDYDKLQQLVIPGRIILARGRIEYRVERREISIGAEEIKSATLSTIRLQAQQMGLFDENEWKQDTKSEEGNTQEVPTEEYIIEFPEQALRDDLFELKHFLQVQKPGHIAVKLSISGKIIDTKLTVSSDQILIDWIRKKWSSHSS